MPGLERPGAAFPGDGVADCSSDDAGPAVLPVKLKLPSDQEALQEAGGEAPEVPLSQLEVITTDGPEVLQLKGLYVVGILAGVGSPGASPSFTGGKKSSTWAEIASRAWKRVGKSSCSATNSGVRSGSSCFRQA